MSQQSVSQSLEGLTVLVFQTWNGESKIVKTIILIDYTVSNKCRPM